MCLVIYTLHTLCRHRQYSNTFLCHIARGAESHEAAEYTLSETRFLPDADNQPIHQQQDAGPPCPKRYPTRPVNTLCEACKRSQLKRQAFGEDHPVVASASGRRNFSHPFSAQPSPAEPSSSQLSQPTQPSQHPFSQPCSSQPASSQPSSSQPSSSQN
ncbi:hypothetical protein CONLIGDRAFT_684335 [Coniochaeta ligniaria NRRL 30616]|uniref:Uncharacterized protein n=1 Tax=Coniochaeta ligniaria NRRL 30616 TaxID=1408157 RepID=A0A1J7JDZ0_9PEZI|nr:hypothetical protein CONLIGDRAFT_684335 [Coniochaeta ligniaria NRRL 30616]